MTTPDGTKPDARRTVTFVDDVLITQKLERRPSRTADYGAESLISCGP